MAFTDLAEHLEEVFGDNQRVNAEEELARGRAFVLRRAAIVSASTPERAPALSHARGNRRTLATRARDTARGIAWRSQKRLQAQSRALEVGERPWRCQRPGCSNLLPVARGGGKAPLYCRRTCRMAKYNREARRTPEALRRKRERWNESRRMR